MIPLLGSEKEYDLALDQAASVHPIQATTMVPYKTNRKRFGGIRMLKVKVSLSVVTVIPLFVALFLTHETGPFLYGIVRWGGCSLSRGSLFFRLEDATEIEVGGTSFRKDVRYGM